MEKFEINVVKLKYPKRKKDRKGKTIEDFLAEYFRKKGYVVLFSRVNHKYSKMELDYPSFFRNYPTFFEEKIPYHISLDNGKSIFFPDFEKGRRTLNESIKSKKDPQMWAMGKQITLAQLKKGIEKTEKNIKLPLSKRKKLNEEYGNKYIKFKSSFPNESQKLKKINLGKGKPDLFIFNNKEFFFCEVKSHNDGFHKNQVEWFLKHIQFPYRLVFVV